MNNNNMNVYINKKKNMYILIKIMHNLQTIKLQNNNYSS